MALDTLNRRRVLTLGADPEMFVFSGAKLLPAFMFLPSKEKGELMYWDGFQAEWKYDYDGKHCQNNLVLNTRQALIELSAKAHAHDPKAKLSLVNVIRAPKYDLENAPQKFIELGCEPSYNAYGLPGLKVGNPREFVNRSCGGHMHFGTWLRRPPYKPIVKTLDKILGVWSVGAARNLDNPVRRLYYGLPGEYRKPKYEGGFGVEYRVLSNFWIAAPSILQLTWDLGRACVHIGRGHKHLNAWASTEDEVIDTIKNSDTKQAEKILTRNAPMFDWLLKEIYTLPSAIRKAKEVFHEGIEAVVPNPHDVPKNWHFEDEWIPNGGQPWARWETHTEGLK